MTRSSGRARSAAAFRNSRRSNSSSATASPPVARSGIRTPRDHRVDLAPYGAFALHGLDHYMRGLLPPRHAKMRLQVLIGVNVHRARALSVRRGALKKRSMTP